MTLSETLTIKIMQALHGDAIRIRYFGTDQEYHNVFIDGGFVKTYKATLQKEVRQILNSGERIDLFVITHTDRDHISGILAFIREFGDLSLVDQYWFNSSNLDVMVRFPSDKISIGDGIKLRNYLEKLGIISCPKITAKTDPFELGGAIFTILSPTKECLDEYKILWQNEETDRDVSENRIASCKDDYDSTISELAQNSFIEDAKLENGVSITFLFQVGTKSVLFLADSHPSTIVRSLKRLGYSEKSKLKVDYVKLSHHGSKSNTNNDLLALLDCSSFIISANGNNRFHLPNKETFARILLHPLRDISTHIRFIFNYDNDVIRNIFTEREKETFNFSCHYPDLENNGYTISY